MNLIGIQVVSRKINAAFLSALPSLSGAAILQGVFNFYLKVKDIIIKSVFSLWIGRNIICLSKLKTP